MSRYKGMKFFSMELYVRSLHGNPFPIDMLRYDNCVPASEQDANIIRATLDPSDERSRAGTTVKLTMFKPDGNPACATKGRWESFGWGVIPVMQIEQERSDKARSELLRHEGDKLPRSTFDVLKTDPHIVIDDKDVGMSVTNDAERVCRHLVNLYGNKRIFYYDTIGNFDELVHENGEFRSYCGAGNRQEEVMGEKRR